MLSRALSLALVLAAPALCAAQASTDAPPPSGSALDPDSYVALSADQDAQTSLSGFRAYLERTREADARLYRVLDLRLDDLESRDTAADVVFWTATGLGVAAMIAAIPVYTELSDDMGQDFAIGLLVGGASTFVLGLIIQAIVRPSHGDLVALIDLHDQHLGRR